MKILYVITSLGLGGAERVVVDLAGQMNALGHTVKIAYLTGEVLVRPVSDDIEVIALNLNSKNDLLSASIKYKKLLKKIRPDIVHAHMVHANIFARINRVGAHIPKLICTAHNSNEGGKARMLAYRLTNRLSDINTNVSQEATDSLIRKGAFRKSNVMTVHNGIDLSKFEKVSSRQALDQNVINLISVGRFNDQKDYPNLINAFAELKKNITTNVRLTIVGDGELRPQIKAMIKQLDLDNDIVLFGRRSDIPELLSQADVFVLASKHEGLPTVVIEAMACECYVVATDCGGSAEVLGDTGQLVPIQDSQALATALQATINLSNEDRTQNNKKARARVEEFFSLETSVKKWLALYEAK